LFKHPNFGKNWIAITDQTVYMKRERQRQRERRTRTHTHSCMHLTTYLLDWKMFCTYICREKWGGGGTPHTLWPTQFSW